MLAICVIAAGCGTGTAAPSSALEFGAAEVLSQATAVGAAPMLAVSPAGAEAAAWVSAPGGGTDGRLYVSVDGAAPVEIRDPLGPIEAHGEAPPKLAYGRDGALSAIYVVGKEVPESRFPLAALRYIRSTDGGRSWSAPATVTSDGEFGSHNFHALHAASDGAIYVSWLGSDGSKAASKPGASRSGTWIARSLDQGRSWSERTRVHAGESCPCCRTALASAPDGTLYLAWRTVMPGSVRDIVIARSSDGGRTWSDPVRVHADGWVFDGCPHAGPALQVDSAGTVHVAWWTGDDARIGTWYARSADGAKTFTDPVRLSAEGYSTPAHPQLALTDGQAIVAAWDDGAGGTPRVLVRVSRDGGARWSEPQVLSEDGVHGEYPVVNVSPRGIGVAWSQRTSGEAHHAAANAPNMKDPKARKPLAAVGGAQVMMRRAAME